MTREPPQRRTPAQRLWRAIGAGLFGLGLLGLALPVLPTVPFWILAVFALQRSDPAMAERIRRWPGVGPVVAEFVDHGVMRPASKRAALIGIAIAALIVSLTVPVGPAFYLAIGGMAVGALYVATRPTRRRS